MTSTKYTDVNRTNWDERVPVHVASEMYAVEGFMAGGNPLPAVQMDELGDVRGRTMVHLQCHIGLDTLSWTRLGAEVTGIDFSPQAIEAARRISEESGVAGRFIEGDVYQTHLLLERQFDIVYTGVGALCWLPDVKRWAEVVGRLLNPGGTFYIHEFHPVLWALDADRTDGVLAMTEPYFETAEPNRWEGIGTYADENATFESTVTYEWNHGMGEIITSLIQAGLRIEFLHEQPTCVISVLPGMIETEEGWVLPGKTMQAPMMYSIRAVKTG